MEFSKEINILSPSKEEIAVAEMLQETDYLFLTDREIWILNNLANFDTPVVFEEIIRINNYSFSSGRRQIARVF